MDGAVDEVLDEYSRMNFERLRESGLREELYYTNRRGNREIVIESSRFLKPDGTETQEITTGDPLIIETEYFVKEKVPDVFFNFYITDLRGIYITSLHSIFPEETELHPRAPAGPLQSEDPTLGQVQSAPWRFLGRMPREGRCTESARHGDVSVLGHRNLRPPW